MRTESNRLRRFLLRPSSVAAILLICLMGGARAVTAQPWMGVNLAGAEFGEGQLPGSHGTDYIHPTPGEIDYFVGKGMNVLRIPFRWERLQLTLGGPLDAAELSRLESFVDDATAVGAHVILDPHNYARYHGDLIGSGAVPISAFADFWSRLAARFASQPRVIFGLMNEPHGMPTEQWLSAANAAIAAIRAAGADNLILVPGNAWTGAHSWSDDWYGTPNAVAMLGVVDPADHFAFEVHQYLDGNSSGTSPEILHETIGSERLAGFTAWLRQHGFTGLLGEFAVARSTIGDGPAQIGDEAVDDLLAHIEANSDVWLGWVWWAAGPWWGEYMFTLEPEHLGEPDETDRPQLAVLQPHLLPEPASGLAPGAVLVALLSRSRLRRRM